MIEERTCLVLVPVCDLCKHEFHEYITTEEQSTTRQKELLQILLTKYGWVLTNSDTGTLVCDECSAWQMSTKKPIY